MEEITELLKNQFNLIEETLNQLKCCGNCLNHDHEPIRGFCNTKNKITHSCFYCNRWSFDNLDNFDRRNFEIPKEEVNEK